ncbi:Probable adenylate kinase 7, mitochondrial [Linum grandiflorum]
MAALSRVGFAAAPSTLGRLGSLACRRAYGSAAAAEYNYYDDEGEQRSHYSGLDASPSPGLTSERGVQWVLIGDPGVKKHLYAEKLSKVLQVPHISMGTLLRQELNPTSALYKQIFSRVNEGKLVPEEVIFVGLLTKRLEEGYSKGESGFILDGIPRTRLQAEILDLIADIDLVVNFKSAEHGLVKSNFASIGHSPSATGLGRSCEEKLCVYAEEGKALENYYRKQRKLLDFDAVGKAGGDTWQGKAGGDTWQGLLAALHLKNANALLSSNEVAT